MNLDSTVRLSYPIYNPNIDSINYGVTSALFRRGLISGSWWRFNDDLIWGSRSLNSSYFGTNAAGDMTTRGCNKSQLSWGDMEWH